MNMIKNLVQYSGVEKKLPDLMCVKGFKEINLEHYLELPERSMDIRQIISVTAKAEASCTRMKETMSAASFEGQILTGRNLIVEGEIQLKLQYVEGKPSSQAQGISLRRPFCSYVVIDKDIPSGIPIAVKAYIQDIYAKIVDSRNIYFNVNMMLVAE